MSIRQGNKIIAGNVDNADYTTLLNKPQINSIELNGNKTLEELGIQASGDYATTSELELKADKADTLAGYGITDGLNTSQITNCITEIPQDIKLELNSDHTITLKAGSKLYIPNGFETDGITRKFDTKTIESDINFNASTHATSQHMVSLLSSNLIQALIPETQQFSGDTEPTVTETYAFWYDTANNIVKYTTDNGSTWINGCSLPFGLISIENNTGITSIDQVFNGFGYIGSTDFILPNVKGIYSVGLNENGTYKIQEYIVPSIRIKTLDNNINGMYWVGFDSSGYYGTYTHRPIISTEKPNVNNVAWFNPNTGFTLYINNSGEITTAKYGEFIYAIKAVSKGKIINWKQIGNTLALVTTNDSSWIAQQAMPSNKYVDLTLGASGSTYTAPANGWFYLAKSSSAANQFIAMEGNVGMRIFATDINANLPISISCQKGESVKISYSVGGTTNIFRFVYAEGEL